MSRSEISGVAVVSDGEDKGAPSNGVGSNGNKVAGVESHAESLTAADPSLILRILVEQIIASERSLDTAMAEVEAAVIRAALQQQQGNRSAAARQLQLPRQTLQDRMKKHGLWSS